MRRNIGQSFMTFLSVVVMMVLVLAGTAHAQLVWKGHTWNETTGGMAGVAQGNPANISVDSNGYLHLTITNRNGTYTASEMFSTDKMGFGTYQWQIQGAVDNMDKSTVLGLFPYGPAAGIGADGENELDIELSHWNNGACLNGPSCNADFTFYPATGNKALGPKEDDFIFTLSGGTLVTARLEWTPTSVTGTLMSGLQPIGTTQNVLRTFTLAPPDYTQRVPQVALPLGMNFWSFQALPASNQSVIIQDFQFVPQGSADFGFSATPASQTVTAGSGTSYTATVSSLNGFTGAVALSASGLPTGASASFSPTSVSGGSGSSTLSVSTSSSTPAGTYTLTLTGTSGSLSHTANVTLVVSAPPSPDFSISSSPSSQTVIAGNSGSYTLSITPVNGFSGTVGFSASGLPTGASASFNPTSVSGGSGSSTLSVSTSSSTPAGTYTLTVTCTSGSLSHTIHPTLVVSAPNFSLSASPSSQTVTVGSGTSYTATVSAVNGFTGAVTFSASGLPTGASASFNPTSVNGSGTSTMSVTTSGSTPAGTYTLTITGTSGSLTHSATVTLVANAVVGTTPVYQVNSGGPAVAPFAADAYFTGGTQDVTTGGTVNTTGVTNAAPEPVYDTERWGPFTYTMPNLTAGASYTVRLHFAEIYWTAAGQRSFNVLINGTQVLTNFDIIAAAGAAKKATVQQFTATANASGQIVVQYTAGVNSNDNNPKSSAIEIIK